MADQVDSDPRIFAEAEFRHLLGREVQRATRYQDFLALCLARPEYPGAPDPQVHRAIATMLAELLRATDLVGLIGETIAVLLLHTPHADALAVMERVSNQTSERFGDSGAQGALTLHLGLVAFPEHATSDSALLERAQASLAGDGDGRPAPPPQAPPQ